jgi:methanogenic corrinoid protein MtbC1/DNA-binding XRE family transcriptional regulator
MTDFAVRLRELRKLKGLRQKDLADSFGLAQTTIANYERKLRFPDEPTLGRFADFFNVSLDYLLGRSDSLVRPEGDPSAGIGIAEPSDQPLPPSSAAHEYISRMRHGGMEPALEWVEVALREGMSIQQVYLEVLEPALKEVGRLWERGELSVGEEHLVSQRTELIMSRLLPAREALSDGRPELRCCCLAVSSELHHIGPRMVADFMHMDGWDASFIGGNLGIRHVVEVLRDHPPELLAVSVTFPVNLGEAVDLVSAIRSNPAFRTTKIMVGGRAFHSRPFLWQEIGADGTGRDAQEAVRTANTLVGG